MNKKKFSKISEILQDAKRGKMFILVDDEGRENEGDLIVPAQMATPEAVNFMAKFGRGLICLSLTCERLRELDLPLMAQRNASRHQTAFTVSIEAREGVTTGISASDRARTISVAIDPTKGQGDIVCPGHIFPLEARDGGVLVRAGHTEAAVDVAQVIAQLSANAEKARAMVIELLRSLPAERPPSPIDTCLDAALITAPPMRDPALLAKLDAVAGRVL